MTEIKPNSSYVWNPEDKITITGIEYSIIQKTLAMFEPGLVASQAIFQRMLDEGIAKEQNPEPQATVTSEPEILEAIVVDPHVPHVD